ncbi:MAG: tetratricopeptide repeat protein [Luteibaculaceae bacterium]
MEFFDDSFDEFDETVEIVSRFEKMLMSNEEYFFDLEEYELMIDYYFDIQNINKANIALKYANRHFPESTGLKLREAQIASSNGKLNSALSILNKLEMLNPLDEDVLLTKASLLSQLKQHKKAIEYFERVIALGVPQKDDILIDMALEYEFMQDYQSAIERLREALTINPENEAALYEISYCYDMVSDTNACISFLKEFLDENPYSYTAWLNLGNCYMKIDNYTGAIEALEYCVAIKEDFSFAHLNIALSNMEIEAWQNALDAFTETLKYEPPRAMTLCYMGECHEKLGNLKEAKKFYQKALAEDDTWSDAWVGLGVLLDIQGKTEEAIPFLKKAVACDDGETDNYLVLAEAYIRISEFEKAQDTIEELLDFDPGNQEALITLSELMHINHNAEESFERLLESLLFVDVIEAPLKYRMAALGFITGHNDLGMNFLTEGLEEDFPGHKAFLAYLPEAITFAPILELINLYKNQNN